MSSSVFPSELLRERRRLAVVRTIELASRRPPALRTAGMEARPPSRRESFLFNLLLPGIDSSAARGLLISGRLDVTENDPGDV